MAKYGFLKPWEAAKYLGIPVDEIYDMLDCGELPGVKIDGLWRIKWDELERWLDEEVPKEELIKLSKRLKGVAKEDVNKFLSQEISASKTKAKRRTKKTKKQAKSNTKSEMR